MPKYTILGRSLVPKPQPPQRPWCVCGASKIMYWGLMYILDSDEIFHMYKLPCWLCPKGCDY